MLTDLEAKETAILVETVVHNYQDTRTDLSVPVQNWIDDGAEVVGDPADVEEDVMDCDGH